MHAKKTNKCIRSTRPALSYPRQLSLTQDSSLSYPSEVLGLKQHEDKEQGMTQHEMPHSKNHKATQPMNHTRSTALERSVAYM